MNSSKFSGHLWFISTGDEVDKSTSNQAKTIRPKYLNIWRAIWKK